jgi:hypothetical protein
MGRRARFAVGDEAIVAVAETAGTLPTGVKASTSCSGYAFLTIVVLIG